MLYKRKICTVGENLGLCAHSACVIVMKVKELLGEGHRASKVFIQKVDENDELIEEGGIAFASSIMDIIMLAAPHNCRLAVYTEDPELYQVVDEVAVLIEEYRI